MDARHGTPASRGEPYGGGQFINSERAIGIKHTLPESIIEAMKTFVRVRTRVLPGRRIEVSDPSLPEGEEVDVLVLSASPPSSKSINLYEWFHRRPPQPKPRGAESWEAYEQLLKRERDAWE